MRKRINKIVNIFLILVLFVTASNATSTTERSIVGCFKPTNIKVQEETANSFQVTWNDFTSSGDFALYEIHVNLFGESPDFNIIDTSYIEEFTFENLLPGQSYDVYLRTVCISGTTSWTSASTFHTNIINGQACPTSIHIPDNNCQKIDTIFSIVNQIDGKLGNDLFLQEIRLTIQHAWPADLEISLQSPAGKSVNLLADNGAGYMNFGDINDPCLSPLILDMDACENISSSEGPYIGSFKPIGDLSGFYDGSSANGKWAFIICDDAQGQTGSLRFSDLIFTESVCSAPDDVYFNLIEDEHIDLIIPESNCDSIEISYMNMDINEEVTIYIPCTGDTIRLEDLTPSTAYMLSYSAMCQGTAFSSSCPKEFMTRCTASSIYTSFDKNEACEKGCMNPCEISTWTNAGQANWLIHSGSTTSSNTGPDADFFGGEGKYAYLESSDTMCRELDASLISPCLTMDEIYDCNMSFAYHMNGIDISHLTLEISTNNMLSWSELWFGEKDQGDFWKTAKIDLASYAGLSFHLRFTSTHPTGNFGDIAIDEVILSGITETIEGSNFIFADVDLDGFGDPNKGIAYCGNSVPPGFSINDQDCNDLNPDINPDADELPCNITDDNCDGQIDENQQDSDLNYNLLLIADQNCMGSSDGSLSIEAIGGTPPYTYLWNDGNMDSDRDGLDAGFYQAIIEDNAGCQAITDSFEIKTIQQFDYIINSVTSATCFGINDGSILISHDMENAPFTYLWSNGDTTQNLTNATSGSYSLSITDINSCIIESPIIELTAQRTISIDIDSIEHIDCSQNTNGYLSIHAQNTVGNVNFLWSNSSTDSILTDLDAGMYSITVEDGENCTSSDSFLIIQPEKININLQTNDPVLCYGENSGLLEVSVTGGSPPYSIVWNNGALEAINTDLYSGDYQVTVTDAHDCLDSLEGIFVSQFDSLQLSISNQSPSLCSFDNSGEITIDIQGGTADYNIYWSDDKDHQLTATNLSSGQYTVTVVDQFECKTSIENIGVSFIDIPLFVDIDTFFNLDCYQDNSGSIDITLQNSTAAPYYYISGMDTVISLSQTHTLTNLAAESFNIQVLDGNGCIGSPIEVILTEPDSITLQVDLIDNICYGDSLGIIELNIDGGTSPFTINWNTGLSSSMITDLPKGFYSATVIDSAGCIQNIDSILINEPSAFSLDSIQQFAPLCHGSTSGIIEIHASGGSHPYSITWNDFVGEQSHTNLSSGQYIYSIVDQYNCVEFRDTIELADPLPLKITLDSIYPSICNSNIGYIKIEVSGEQGDLNYSWSDNISTSAFAQNLIAGVYNITVTDSHNCIDSLLQIEILDIQNDLIVNNIMLDSVFCYGSNTGVISLNISGQGIIPPFDIFLDDILNQTSNENDILINHLVSDSYTVEIIDGNNCRTTINDLLIESSPMVQYDLSVLDSIQCYQDSNGVIAISASGGNGGFEYLWNNQAQGDTLYHLGPGVYTCAIKDQKNCIQFTDTIILKNPDSLYLSANILDAQNEENNGAIYLETFGGKPPYMYIWDPLLPSHVDTLEGLAESEWNLTLVDNNGCEVDTMFIISRVVGTNELENIGISYYPNPAKDYINISTELNDLQHINIYDLNARLVLSRSAIDQESIRFDIQHLYQGQYFIEFVLNDKRVFGKLIIL